MLILETWNGSRWQKLMRIPPGDVGLIDRWFHDGHSEVLYVSAEDELTTVSTADDEGVELLLTLHEGEGWEVLLRFDRVPGATLCRLRQCQPHRVPA